MAKDIRLPSDARFSCQSCGRCCQGWTITVDQQTVERLREHDWGCDPFERTRAAADGYRIKMIDGRCFFLQDDLRCRIHGELGYDAKPAGCKSFPLRVTEFDGATFGRLSYYCPTVSNGKGKPLRDQLRWVRAVAKSAGEIRRSRELTLDGERKLDKRAAGSALSTLESLLGDRNLRLVDRLAAAAGFLRALHQSEDDPIDARLVQQTAGRSFDTLKALGHQDAKASHAGPLFALYLGQDSDPSKLSRAARFFSVRAANWGLIALRSRFIGTAARWSTLRKIQLAPEASDAMLTQYLQNKLTTRRIVANDATLQSGFNQLVAAYAIAIVLARLAAHAAGRSQTDDQDLRRGIEGADLLVLEHSAIDQGRVAGLLRETLLANNRLFAAIAARLALVD